jgi:hypothetical protein
MLLVFVKINYVNMIVFNVAMHFQLHFLFLKQSVNIYQDFWVPNIWPIQQISLKILGFFVEVLFNIQKSQIMIFRAFESEIHPHRHLDYTFYTFYCRVICDFFLFWGCYVVMYIWFHFRITAWTIMYWTIQHSTL